ncbi:MAG TPA: TIGR02678 family protein [Acidimicrobiales bacterium]|nr:TIGR02678 family protein [Acidimicrobiales bacterium]
MSITADELQQAVRGLLAEPIVGRDSPTLALVRRHRGEIGRWFADELGYRLDATRPGVARLAKLPGPGHEPRGMRTRSGRHFDGCRYALTCLVLASAENAGDRTTLARLFEEVAVRASVIDGLDWDGEAGADRRVFIQAVQAASDLGVLEKADGDEERFARGEAGGDALYRIDRERLSLLPTAPQPPTLVAGPDELATEPYPDTEDGRNRRRRHRVTRALVEQPVVYHDDLTPDELDYLRSQRSRLERLLADRVGLTLEVRAEGWVAVDEGGELRDLRWPDYGAPETTALRLCDQLRARAQGGDPAVWPADQVVAFVRGLADEYAGYWRGGADAAAGAEALAQQAAAILVAGRLGRWTPEGLEARPGAGRYAAADAVRPEPTAALPLALSAGPAVPSATAAHPSPHAQPEEAP